MVKKRTGDKRLPIKISVDAYEACRGYSVITGIPIVKVISEAVADWMNTTGVSRIESLQRKSLNN